MNKDNTPNIKRQMNRNRWMAAKQYPTYICLVKKEKPMMEQTTNANLWETIERITDIWQNE